MSDDPTGIDFRAIGDKLRAYAVEEPSGSAEGTGGKPGARSIGSVLREREFSPSPLSVDELNRRARDGGVVDVAGPGRLALFKRVWLGLVRRVLRPYDTVQRRNFEEVVRLLNRIPSYVDERCGELEARDHAVAQATERAFDETVRALCQRMDLMVDRLDRELTALSIEHEAVRSTLRRLYPQGGGPERWEENLAVHQIPTGEGSVWVINERAIEIPYVLRNVPPAPARVLDVGCCESTLSVQLAALGLETWSLDARPYPVADLGLERLTFVRGDVRRTSFADGFFDCVISLSTLEHIGLITYENAELDPDGDRKAILEMGRVLKRDGGRMLVTVPFGQHGATSWYRVYDQAALDRLLEGFRVLDLQTYRRVGNSWSPCSPEEASAVDSITGDRVSAVACVTAGHAG